MNCFFCKKDVNVLKSIFLGPFFKEELKPTHHRMCFDCVKDINTLVAAKYREHGWHITKDALVTNTEYDSETKESA